MEFGVVGRVHVVVTVEIEDLTAQPGGVSNLVPTEAELAPGKVEQVDVPIARAVHAIVEGRISVDDAIQDLMARPPKAEYAPEDRVNS